MSNLIISYDLRNQRDYQSLYNAISTLGNTSKVLESVWYVRSQYTAVQCRDYLMKYLDNDDGIAVWDCTNNTWATYGVNVERMKQLWTH
ncbi:MULTISPECIES: hypothetical protein [Gallibacterium]|uniref:CRISPR-associated protein Cas2 n=1 Tax=Gallibacterium genomosp. 1 TaxID=155515 RepID=A0AB36DZ32_9PAST|nr:MULTISPECIES: hypothetical protein [Gallibacterium]KGQ64551.1 hypothetical protein IO47_11565 [Gallibacterium anatis]KGQ66171.1 hypothetical protein IO49_05945 [Gallibacterium anatis]MBP4134431.1 hypothetical protein [Gallibacterium anatis]OBX00463.1 hypothetical protein QV05_07690 [Gallibacterium genomosp. 1]OBX02229.1 hypothetical protein QV04_04150 [Gallibacterium genomosp. 1]